MHVPRVILHESRPRVAVRQPQALLKNMLWEAWNAEIVHTIGKDEVACLPIYGAHLAHDIRMIDHTADLECRSILISHSVHPHSRDCYKGGGKISFTLLGN